MSKEDLLLFGTYGMRSSGKSYYEKLNEKDKEIEALKYIIKDVYSCIHHELHGHILQHDEETWNPEYYTKDKLDYRKLLIGLLSDYENRLSKGIDRE